jgi:hypothetical protein
MFGIENFLQTQSAFFINNGQIINLSVGLVAAVATIFAVSRNPKIIQKPNPVHVLCLLLYGYAFLSWMWTPAADAFGRRWLPSYPYLGLFLVLGPILTQDKTTIRDGLRWTLMIGIPVMFLTAFYCRWGSRGMILAAPVFDGNKMSNEALPLAIAGFASYVGIIALVIHSKIPLNTYLRFAILGVALYVAFRTRSRGQVLGIIGVAAVIYPISNKIGDIKGILISVFGLFSFALIIYYITTLMDLQRWQTQHVEDAVYGRGNAWLFFLQEWITTSDFRVPFGLGATAAFAIIGFYPHNLPVEILAELGLVGFGLFVAIIWKSAVNGIRLIQRLEKKPEIRSEVLSLLGLLFLSLLLAQKEGSLYTWQILFFFAITISQREIATRKEMKKSKLREQQFLHYNHAFGAAPR